MSTPAWRRWPPWARPQLRCSGTLAARLAVSVRTPPYAAIAAALATLSGELHGSSAAAAVRLLVDASQRGAALAIRDLVDAGRRVPGFGHTVYRTGDPRLSPLLEAVRRLPNPPWRLDVVDDVLAEASVRVTPRPNVDFGLAALVFVGGLDADAPIFAVARLAGWAAHIDEELAERPLRFRGLAKPVPAPRSSIGRDAGTAVTPLGHTDRHGDLM